MAGVVITMSGDEARLFQAMAKVLAQQDKLNNKLKDTGKTSEETGRKTKDSYDKMSLSVGKLTGSLVGYAAGLVTIEAGVTAIKTAWELVRKEQEAGLNALKSTQSQDRRLLQISTSPEEFNRFRAQSDSLSNQFGVDRTVTREVLFSAVSEGFRDAVPAIIAANRVVDPTSAAGVAGQAPALFKGTIGALEAVNLTLKAAQASRLNFEQIAGSLPQASEGASVAKATAEETLAVLSVLASEFKSGETAADRIKAFATASGISDQFAGQGIVAVVEKLQAMDEAGRKDFLGSSAELNVAYVKMSDNLDLIKQRVEEFNREGADFAAGGGLLRSQTAIANNDPFTRALVIEARAKMARESGQVQDSSISGAATEAARITASGKLAKELMPIQVAGAMLTPIASTLAANAGLSPEASAEIGAGAPRAAFALGSFGFTEIYRLLFVTSEKLDRAAYNLEAASARLGNATPQARAAAAGASQ